MNYHVAVSMYRSCRVCGGLRADFDCSSVINHGEHGDHGDEEGSDNRSLSFPRAPRAPRG